MNPRRVVVLLLLTFVVVVSRADAEPSAADRKRREEAIASARAAGILGKAPKATFFGRSSTIRLSETLEQLLPKVFVVQTPSVSPGGDPRAILRFVQTHLDVVYPCFQQPFGGDGAIFFAIDATGQVLDATDSDEEDDLVLRRFEKCFAKQAARWRFPAREFGSRIKVTLGFTAKRQHMARLIEEIKDRARIAQYDAPGAGTIGSGKLGTIGPAASGRAVHETCVTDCGGGRGAMRLRRPGDVELSTVFVGRVDQVLRRRLRSGYAHHQAELRACWDAELLRRPTAEKADQELLLRVTFAASGSVERVAVESGATPALGACVVERVNRWVFDPPPLTGSSVTVSVRLALHDNRVRTSD